MQVDKKFKKQVCEALDLSYNRFHPLVWILGEPKIGNSVYIGGFTEVYAKGANVEIGDFCDIASFVVINCADSHMKTIEKSEEIERKNIKIGAHTFIGTHACILGGCDIGDHCVIGAGVVLKDAVIPPYSLVTKEGVKEGYYK